MRDGGGADGSTQLTAGHWSQLVAVEVDAQAGLLAGAEDALRRVPLKHTLLAEDVDGVHGQCASVARRQHRWQLPLHHIRGSCLLSAATRDGMRAQEGRADLQRVPIACLGQNLQHLDLRLRLQPVSRLGLHQRRACGQHAVQPRQQQAHQLLGWATPRMIDRVLDATARFVNVQVASARKLHRELVHTVSAPHRVRVSVHEPRQHAFA
mmetsp:Transcript_22734/g.73134  ORF Transcript_22734/g.73134 Transcript_22734/m.73134 type:complete len:209 (-) Transcript_22734:235-861(-)